MSEEISVVFFSGVAGLCQKQFFVSCWYRRHLHLCGEENALPLAVWGRDSLQLQEVQKNLNLKEKELIRKPCQLILILAIGQLADTPTALYPGTPCSYVFVLIQCTIPAGILKHAELQRDSFQECIPVCNNGVPLHSKNLSYNLPLLSQEHTKCP